MEKKLVRYATKADFMNIAIELDGKAFRFNLDNELRVSVTNITNELKDQPRAYAFLCMLRHKILVKLKDEQKNHKRKKDKLFLKYKQTMEKVTEASARAADDPLIQKLEDKLDAITQIKDVLDIAINSFEQRSRLIQTLSANERPKIK